jgi:hypothetical protein
MAKRIYLIPIACLFILVAKGNFSKQKDDVSYVGITQRVENNISSFENIQVVEAKENKEEILEEKIDTNIQEEVYPEYTVDESISSQEMFLMTPENKEAIDNVYNYLTENGYSDEAACGIIGNAIFESSLDKSLSFTDSSYHGYYQMSSIVWTKFLDWAYENGYDASKFTSQTIWIASESLEDDFKYYSPISLEDYKQINRPDSAADAFCVAFERAISNGDGDYGISEFNGQKYQNLAQRKEWAKFIYNYYH